MYIGEASKASGATIKAIRLYDKLGLLPNLARVNSYRVFTEEDILLIKFIRMAKKFDFKLTEIKQIIYPKEGDINWERIKKEIDLKEKNISKEILRLQESQKKLNGYSSEISKCLTNNKDCIFPQTNN